MPSPIQSPSCSTDYPSRGGRLVAADGRPLPLKGTALSADARGGLARVVLEQTFHNPYPEPLQVTYQLPLPADGAVSGYAFRVGDRRIVGEVAKKQDARERFERALTEGRTAALMEQERSSFFTQELGNIPPGAELVAELTIDQKLQWLPEGSWEWRFPTVIAPRYLGEPGSVPDHRRVTVSVADRPLPVRASLSLTVRDRLAEGRRPESPSHPLHVSRLEGRHEIGFHAEEGASLDRDVVVRWPAAAPEVGASLSLARPKDARTSGSTYGLLTLVPPEPKTEPTAVPRDLIILLDTSGSMSGAPLEQAKRIVAALLSTLTAKDRLELIEFSSAPRRWKRSPVNATEGNRKGALSWLKGLSAGGGTEMRSGVLEALRPLRSEAQRQVVLLTDGLIGGEGEVISSMLAKLPPESRFHAVGVGSAVNRSLTAAMARAGRGAELIVSLDEDAERAAKRLVARTAAPLVTALEVSGSAVEEVAPSRTPDLFAGAPALLSLKLSPRGGELVIRGRTAHGAYEERLSVPAVEPGEGSGALAALFARESVEDCEMRLCAGGSRAELDPRIEGLGLAFQISTRLTSWVAVGEVSVDPTLPTRREELPQELPYGMCAEGLGLRSAMLPPPPPMAAAPSVARTRGAAPPTGGRSFLGEIFSKAKGDLSRAPREEERESTFDELAPEPSEAEDLGAAPLAAPSFEAAAARRLEGIVRYLAGEEVIVELTVDSAGLEWEPPDELSVTLADGRILTVQVDRTRSTRPVSAAAGTTLRLTFRLASDAAGVALVALRFESRGAPLEVVL